MLWTKDYAKYKHLQPFFGTKMESTLRPVMAGERIIFVGHGSSQKRVISLTWSIYGHQVWFKQIKWVLFPCSNKGKSRIKKAKQNIPNNARLITWMKGWRAKNQCVRAAFLYNLIHTHYCSYNAHKPKYTTYTNCSTIYKQWFNSP